jgi:hypothetical protein
LNLKSSTAARSRLVERGQQLEYFTIFWNSLETLAALISGFIAGSVALVAFSLDSLIEVTSGAALLWRLHQDKNTLRRESAERLSLRIVGSCFMMLSAYIAYDSLAALLRREAPARSVPGIVIAVASCAFGKGAHAGPARKLFVVATWRQSTRKSSRRFRIRHPMTLRISNKSNNHRFFSRFPRNIVCTACRPTMPVS